MLDQDDQEIQRYYLEALARIDARAADVAFELGLNSLGAEICENMLEIERQLFALENACPAADESPFAG